MKSHHDPWDDFLVSDWASVEQLELRTENIVDGLIAGRHRSKKLSGTSEFADHRAYAPGDEVRLIDWKVYAKKDRYYIRRYYDQTCLQTVVALDASGSMGFEMAPPSKLTYARALALGLVRLILRQSDAAGLAVMDASLRHYIPPRARADHFHVLRETLREVRSDGPTTLTTNLIALTRRMKRRGLIVLLSDGFDDLEALGKAFRFVRHRGHELIFFHIMAPEELSFDFGSWSRFVCLEDDGLRMDLDPALVRQSYLENLETFLKDLKQLCRETACDYVPLRTDAPLGASLAQYLTLRNARIKQV